ncbi:UDP-N-acetylmuramate--L-alanine ligase [Paracrocinitomix mangrovi]|uniref:UDP-N-acetylmuramate--L-alanine ligase n=1 Tax=Paracrocinitomix mangrovi TaxID=2862509 RepID=UPI001C8D4F04|nr:UDP-N-acetylmuramate--L-alanine ligase [Paracrocinitomix mangrovi]UKN03346.1 UDP-N-acetylmuramate--L-alanine ligase [Paracrocinitomix mangrovi]
MNFNQINNVYFIGIGGIGMSALARYFHSQGKKVEGYDKTSTELTRQLESEGIKVHYEDKGLEVLDWYSHIDTLIIYTPAIPAEFGELKAFQEHHFNVIKRAKALGIISDEFETFAVAGTHGKTTTSTILAHVLNLTEEKCNAFIGGISTNYHSNIILNPESHRIVVEADEFDRSFLNLSPNYAIITSIDSDHLDIYGDGSHLIKSFNDFINLMKYPGTLIINSSIDLDQFEFENDLRIITYGVENRSDYRLHALKYENGRFYFDILGMADIYRNVEFGLPGQHNAENATAVFGLCIQLGVPEEIIRKAFAGFKGVKRRFDFRVRKEDIVVIDDYAHHPTEIDAFLRSVKKLYPNKKITVIFQPHLFSRTRDFMDGFADALGLADELFLLPIYPARELPIEGVTSEVLLEMVNLDDKEMSSLSTIVDTIKDRDNEVICILGAGDIDTIVEPISQLYS